jgi:cation diffusion facilitator CzcD-associated flavoprotein CzcO
MAGCMTPDTESEREAMPSAGYYDVVIIGAGLAGLSLARQLLLNSGKKILLMVLNT